MHSLSILLPNNRLLNPESRSFSVRQAASNLLSSLKHVQRVLVFHCIRTNRINGSVNQCSEIISAFSNGLHTFGRDPDVMSCSICILLKYFMLPATGPFGIHPCIHRVVLYIVFPASVLCVAWLPGCTVAST